MTKQEFEILTNIAKEPPYNVGRLFKEFMKTAKITSGSPERTESQHNSLFLWFSLIEKEAENAGLTWDMIIRHTHQLRVTKENLHGMCKQLMEALWKTTSTKEIKKTGNIDIIIDHFTDLFSKEGLELPPFPHDKTKLKEKTGGYKTDDKSSIENYPDQTEDTLADKF